MPNKKIFISYRRDDSPGYASKLEKDLEHYFGDEHVFRDVEDIPGGEQWKQVLADNLEKSGALLVIIGPRWEQIWNERKDKGQDYIVYELNKAKEQGITIIPVTINGTKLSHDLDLGSISWLRGNQQYDLNDQQGRWPTDVFGLVNLLERQKGIERKKGEKNKEKNGKKWLVIFISLLVMTWLLYEAAPEKDRTGVDDGKPPVILEEPKETTEHSTQVATPQAKETVIITEEPTSKPAEPPQVPQESVITQYPDVSGIWQGEDGTAYQVGKVTNGRFLIGNAEYQGEGQFIPKMPRKFTVKMPGLGHGEYSITTDNMRIVGWFIYSGEYEKEYETLWRVK